MALFIGRLKHTVQEADLREAFSAIGPIKRLDHRDSFAFVTFWSDDEARQAINKLNRTEVVPGCKMNVEWAKESGHRNPSELGDVGHLNTQSRNNERRIRKQNLPRNKDRYKRRSARRYYGREEERNNTAHDNISQSSRSRSRSRSPFYTGNSVFSRHDLDRRRPMREGDHFSHRHHIRSCSRSPPLRYRHPREDFFSFVETRGRTSESRIDIDNGYHFQHVYDYPHHHSARASTVVEFDAECVDRDRYYRSADYFRDEGSLRNH